MVAAAVALLLLAGLVRREGHDPLPVLRRRLVSVVVGRIDLHWRLSRGGRSFSAAHARLVGRSFIAGVCFGLAIGIRASTVGLVGVILAELWRNRSQLPMLLRVGGVTVAVGALCFVPAWLSADQSFAFVTTETQVTSLTTLVGRWGVKNLAFWGPFTCSFSRRGSSNGSRPCDPRADSLLAVVDRSRLGRVGVLAVSVEAAPPAPSARFVALLVGRSERRFAYAVAGGLALNAVVALTVAAPDVPHRATTGDLDVQLRRGVLITDIECRLEDGALGEWPPIGSDEAYDRSVGIFDCQTQLWRSGPRADRSGRRSCSDVRHA